MMMRLYLCGLKCRDIGIKSMNVRTKIVWLLPVLLLLVNTGCNTNVSVSYKKNVAPIFHARCSECHNQQGEGFKASGLSFASYALTMKGTRFGPVINPGHSVSSTLMRLITAKADKSISMPHGDREPLTTTEVDTIKRWIDAGALDN
jgi:uncharacterized membrane protein